MTSGKIKPVLGPNGEPPPGSIAEKRHVDINGVRQGMVTRSADPTQPVLLFVHGGPGMPSYFLEQDYPTGLEQEVTVVYWDQRGTALSYLPDIAPQTMTTAQFIADTIAVTDYLRNRFHQDKIYVLAHSWGTFIAIQAVAHAPELYHAYIGMSQISYQIRSENESYAYMLQRYKELGNARMVRKLEAAPIAMTVPMPKAYMALRDRAMHTLGVGTTHEMKSVVTGIFLRSWLNREYTVGEKLAIWRGRKFSRSFGLWDEMQSTDMTKQITELEVPVYFLHGAHDHTVSYTGAKSYLGHLKAPVKGFYTFPESAHSPAFEEPMRARDILLNDVLKGGSEMADTE